MDWEIIPNIDYYIVSEWMPQKMCNPTKKNIIYIYLLRGVIAIYIYVFNLNPYIFTGFYDQYTHNV